MKRITDEEFTVSNVEKESYLPVGMFWNYLFVSFLNFWFIIFFFSRNIAVLTESMIEDHFLISYSKAIASVLKTSDKEEKKQQKKQQKKQ